MADWHRPLRSLPLEKANEMQTFDDVTRAWAEGVSRREALKLLASATLAAMLAPFAPRAAFAAPDVNVCRGIPPGSCGSFQLCPNRTCSGLGCYCFPHLYHAQPLCGYNITCDLPACTSDADCPKGAFCAQTCCSYPICVKKCRPRTPCAPGVTPGGGLTTAG
jgi:hypothetical protein